jgi:hypothetical protein
MSVSAEEFRKNLIAFRRRIRQAVLGGRAPILRLREWRSERAIRRREPAYEEPYEEYERTELTFTDERLQDGSVLRRYFDASGNFVRAAIIEEGETVATTTQQVRETPRSFLDEWRERSIIGSVRRAFSASARASELELLRKEQQVKAMQDKARQKHEEELEEEIRRLKAEVKKLSGHHY